MYLIFAPINMRIMPIIPINNSTLNGNSKENKIKLRPIYIILSPLYKVDILNAKMIFMIQNKAITVYFVKSSAIKLLKIFQIK